jgi:Tfp pilus assembly protein PilX
MPTTNPKRSCSGSRNGVALLAVLACILLLTILVVSFISFTKLNRVSTAEYSNAVQAQEIAQGGFQDILGDLHAEIVAGSTNNAAYTVNGTSIYVPATNLTAVPARIGYVSTSWATNFTATALSPTLVRVSRATGNPNAVGGDAFFTQIAANTGPYTNNIAAVPGGTILNRASQVSTALSSVNGRAISAARWNKTFLLSTNSTTVPSVFTSAPPDWVYVTQTGSRVCAASELGTSPGLLPSSNLTQNYGTITPGRNPPVSPVVGRYAYVVYDEGALLDANVAGSPSTLINQSTVALSSGVAPASTTDTVSGRTLIYADKSYAASADLYQLPGLNTSNGQTQIDNLIALRNAGGLNGATAPVPGTTYLTSLFQYANYGFSSFVNNGAATPVSDTPFVSRQDLINYFAKIDTNFNTSSATYSQALPYLGTFSRAVSAPSWYPQINSNQDPNYHLPATPTPGLANTAPVAYKSNAETPGIPNRDLANVRFASPGTITHYYDDQTGTATPTGTATYSVLKGDPLIQNRFSLAKINWLSSHTLGGSDPGSGANPATGAAPSATFATAIQACFGLVWGPPGSLSTSSAYSSTTANGGNPCWNYVGSPAGPSGSQQVTINGTNAVIETLDQVAQEGREPNFFELLKAAILNGSLGLCSGYSAFNNGADNAPTTFGDPYDAKFPPNQADILGGGSIFGYSFGTNTSTAPPAPQRIPDIQIMQIGVNIIDQYSSDNYPTAIYFPYNGVGTADPVSGKLANAILGPVDMVYGDKNLPDLTKVVSQICSPDPGGSSDSNGSGPAGSPSQDDNSHSLEGFLQPEIWNPHQAPLAGTTFTNTPHNFEIRAYGTAMTYVLEKGGYLAPAPSSPTAPNSWSGGFTAPASNPGNWGLSNSTLQSYYPGVSSSESPTSGANEQAGTIDFVDGSSTSSFYASPRVLVATGDAGSIPGLTSVTSPLPTPSAGTSAGTTPTNVALSSFPYWAVGYNGTASNHFVAFSAGLISETSFGNPYNPYYVGSGAPNSPISNSNAPGGIAGISFPVTSTGVGCISLALGWTANGHFHPYSFITGGFETAYLNMYDDAGHPPDGRLGAVGNTQTEMGGLSWGNIDPRSGRFFAAGNFVGGGWGANDTGFSQYNDVGETAGVSTTGNFVGPQPIGYVGNGGTFPEDWMINTLSVSTNQRCGAGDPRSGVSPASPAYYADPDGVVRPGDGYFSNVNTGDGIMTYTSAGTGGTAVGDTTATGNGTGNSQHGRRPVILNRPFRSIGELGYVFRDLPFKTLDFFTPSSADAALLDVFSLTDESKVSANVMNSVVAGQVDINNAPLPVLQALVSGGAKKDLDAKYNLGSETPNSSNSVSGTPTGSFTPIPLAIANLVNPATATSLINPAAVLTGAPEPLINRSNLVTQLISNFQYTKVTTGPAPFHIKTYTPLTSCPSTDTADQGNKAYLEAPIRALADVTNTRTWNLLIDVIAQSGQMSPTAKSTDANALSEFIVQGEKRYWLHIAIDRYTGKIVAQQLEPVYE